MTQQLDLLGQIEAADGEMNGEVQLLITLNENEIITTTQPLPVAGQVAAARTFGVELSTDACEGGHTVTGWSRAKDLYPLLSW